MRPIKIDKKLKEKIIEYKSQQIPRSKGRFWNKDIKSEIASKKRFNKSCINISTDVDNIDISSPILGRKKHLNSKSYYRNSKNIPRDNLKRGLAQRKSFYDIFKPIQKGFHVNTESGITNCRSQSVRNLKNNAAARVDPITGVITHTNSKVDISEMLGKSRKCRVSMLNHSRPLLVENFMNQSQLLSDLASPGHSETLEKNSYAFRKVLGMNTQHCNTAKGYQNIRRGFL